MFIVWGIVSMFTVKLKNGQMVQVPLEELETFLEENRDQIEVRHKKMGKRRTIPESYEKKAQSNLDHQESVSVN